jgi:hypothetical protein
VSKEEHFLVNPELNSYINEKLPILLSESDRGAVLIGISQIDNELQKLLEIIAPEDMTNKEKKWIERATLASKLNIAYTCRLLPRNIFESINKLKQIRNDVAHNLEVFNLDDYDDLLKEIFESLGDGVSVFIHNISIKYMVEQAITIMLKSKHNDKPILEDRIAAINHISENKTTQNIIEKPVIKMKLAVGILFISGIIIYERKKTLEIVQENKTFSSIKIS